MRCDFEILLELLITLNVNCDRIDEHHARSKYKKNKIKKDRKRKIWHARRFKART